MPIEVNENEFQDEVIASQKPVLVDFYADWCQPCKMLTPVINNIEDRYNGILKVVKVNIDYNQEIAEDFNISNIPTLVLFKENKVVKTMVGFKPQKALEKEIDHALS